VVYRNDGDEHQRHHHGSREGGTEPCDRPTSAAVSDPGDERVQRHEAADDEQDVDGARGMEEGAPRGADREYEAGHQERDDGQKDERPQGVEAGTLRQGQQAEEADREAGTINTSTRL